MNIWPNKITGANAGGSRQLTMRTRWTARVAHFWREDLQAQRVIAHAARQGNWIALRARLPDLRADVPGVCLQGAIERAARALNLQSMRLPSGAGHDAQMMALIGPMGMIFVPSVGGVSHSPKELTSWDDCARGADVLGRTVLEMDNVHS